MTEWEPATETEVAMWDALRAGDQELYFRILARVDLLLPVSADALAGRAPMGWGTWTTGGRTHVLAFTSGSALRACLAENAGSTRRAPYAELASGWPNPEWWLAVNPGLPIEGYLPAWFVSQLSRGDVRLPGRSIGARARLEQVERAARARATAAVPRRPPDGLPRAEPEPAGPFRSTGPAGSFRSAEPAGSFRSTELVDEPAASVAPVAEPAPSAPPPEPAVVEPVGVPATVPVIAPTADRGELGIDFGSQISDDASAGWMTPTGPVRSASSGTSNGSSAAGASASAAPPPGGTPGGPPPAWYGPAGRPTDQPTAPIEARAPEDHLSDPGTPEIRAPEAWAPPARSEASIFTPASQRPVGESWPGAAESWSGEAENTTIAYDRAAAPMGTPISDHLRPAADPLPPAPPPSEPLPLPTADPLPGSRSAAEPAFDEVVSTEAGPTEPIFVSPAHTQSFRIEPGPTEPIFFGATQTRPGTAESGPFTEPTATEPAVPTEPAVSTEPAAFAEPRFTGEPRVSAAPGAVAEPISARRLPPDFVPANDVERSLLDAAGDGSTDSFLSTLLLAKVLLPVAFGVSPDARPGDDGFEWRTEILDGETYVVVFTSPERLVDHLPSTIETVAVKFAQLIRRWPDDAWSFAVNPGTPVGAKLPGGQIVALANWVAEVGLGDDTDAGEPAAPAPSEEEAPRSTYAPAREDPGRPTMMQKTVAPSQLSYYLDRGYDRVSGFVHRASEVAHLRTPAKLYAALGLGYPGTLFARDAEEIYVLRWPAYRPSLYRIPYGGQNEAAMRAMEGWVIERPPFRGNGFAPGESSDVVAEFKVDSVRLPHGAQLHRIGLDGTERLVATLDCDVPVWRRAEEG